MDEIEVDPALFIRCRLCIENTGVFQVLPKIQEQIKFCFDIDVTSYDGLPQLICKTCKTVLNDYLSIKHSFVEKQDALKQRLLTKKKPVAEEQNDSSGAESLIQFENSSNKKKKRKIIQFPSESSDEDNEVFHLDKDNDKIENISKKSKHITSAWQRNFVREFVCTICKKHCKNKGRLKKHLHKHRKLVAKHGNILNKIVTVSLNKIDNAPNITDSTSNVVFDRNNVISNEGKSNYFILYSKKDRDGSQSRQNNVEDNVSDQDCDNKRNSRTKRLLSNDTVVLGGRSDSSDNEHIVGKNNETECINLDDTSDSEIELKSDETIQPRVSDYKTIQDIMAMCQTNYLRNQEIHKDLPLSAATEAQLKRKILSVGRKIINKQSLNCTGILRYLEHKDLEIKWNQILPSNKESYVVVQSKLRESESANDRLGWKDFPYEPGSSSEVTLDTAHRTIRVDNVLNNDNGNMIIHPLTEQAVVTHNKMNAKTTDSSSKMLLNINPVSNPKQLTLSKVDKPDNHIIASNSSRLYLTPDEVANVENDAVRNDTMCMPIITSTTSLAVPPEQNTVEINIPKAPVSNEIQAPRIKVKPVSELMSERVLKTLSQQEIINTHTGAGVWSSNPNSIPNPMDNQNLLSSIVSQKKTNGHPIPPSLATESKTKTIVLDTVEFPNTRTNSPFKYLQQLLYVHGLILIDSTEKPTGLNICLTKFKIQFKQELIENPIVLHLSILCSENRFFIGIKSGLHADNIDICALDPPWQWKVLTQICQESVVNKAIKISESINPTVMENTKRFFLIMKSIKLKDSPN